MDRIKLTDDDRAKHDKGDDDLQGGSQELFLVLGRVMWNLQFREGEGGDKYRPNAHLEDQTVSMRHSIALMQKVRISHYLQVLQQD